MIDEKRPRYDALLYVSFGGPEGRDDVIPFLENVLRGRNVPRERMEAVAHHYDLFDGVSPINAQNRRIIANLQDELRAHQIDLPVYWGNRNWTPYLTDAMRQMRDDGITHALVFITSAFSSYSSCRQYREDIQRAREAIGEGAPEVAVLRKFYDHPGFIGPGREHLQAALEQIPEERRADAHVVFTAHSIPVSMASHSRYVAQLEEAGRLVMGDDPHPWRLVYQSRSGPPSQPWLEPDVVSHLRDLRAQGVTDAVVLPIGFISDHIEVRYDLDIEAQEAAHAIGLNMVRAPTAGEHPAFAAMIREVIEERVAGAPARHWPGSQSIDERFCYEECCLPGTRG
jgi:ferrochelatase